MRNDAASFVWGSNSHILNNLVVLAHGVRPDRQGRYRDGVLQGMDYVLGRNALNQSYVTGYGEHGSQNQHSRIFAHQLDPKLPTRRPDPWPAAPTPPSRTRCAQKLLAGCVRSSATSTTSSRGRPTSTPSTGTRRWPGWSSFVADQGTADQGTADQSPAGQVAAGHRGTVKP